LGRNWEKSKCWKQGRKKESVDTAVLVIVLF
jgi:hypothetical protein